MNRLHRTLCVLALLAGLIAPPAISASGSYCVCITKPPSDRTKIDRDKYDMGQKIFNGRTQLMPAELTTKEQGMEQKKVLQDLQNLLPKRKAKKMDLTQWAGQLSMEQLDALAYYVQIRYDKTN